MPTLCKQERLFEKKLLSVLFDKGKRFTCSGSSGVDARQDGTASMRICYAVVSRSEVWGEKESCLRCSCKLLVNAPKSRYRHAVDRNRIKRLLREAFRFHKDSFTGLMPEGEVLLLSLQFTGGVVSLDMMLYLVEKTAQTLKKRLSHA